jgi:hypothetical protein
MLGSVEVGPDSRIGLAIVRSEVSQGLGPIIRIVRLDDLFGTERVLVITTSPDEAAQSLREWLWEMIGGQDIGGAGDVEVTPE